MKFKNIVLSIIILLLCGAMYSCSFISNFSKTSSLSPSSIHTSSKISDSSDSIPMLNETKDTSSYEIAIEQNLLNNAEILSQQLVQYCLAPYMLSDFETEIETILIRFVASLGFYPYSNSEHPYADKIGFQTSDIVTITKNDMQQIIFEVFGVSKWDNYSKEEYDADTDSYIIPLGRVVGGTLQSEPIQSIQKDDSIVITLQITGNKGYPSWKDYGVYEIEFKVINENDSVFLRLIKVELT